MTPHLSRRRVASLIAGGLLPTISFAQDFPNKPVRFIVTGPGGSSDVFARVLTDELNKSGIWKSPVIVENKSGAGAVVPTMYVRQSAPDGHTLLINTTAFLVASETRVKPLYDPLRDFAAVALFGKGPLLLAARPDFPYKTLPEFIAEARRNPEKFTFGSTGTGGLTHLGAELLWGAAGVKLRHIPFKGGTQVVNALAGSQIDVYLGSVAASLPLVEGNRLKGLAVTSPEPTPSAPSLPTVAQTIRGFNLELWWGAFAPAKTPAPIVQELNRQINAVLARQRVRESFAQEGAQASNLSVREFEAFLQADQQQWRKAVISSNFVKEE